MKPKPKARKPAIWASRIGSFIYLWFGKPTDGVAIGSIRAEDAGVINYKLEQGCEQVVVTIKPVRPKRRRRK